MNMSIVPIRNEEINNDDDIDLNNYNIYDRIQILLYLSSFIEVKQINEIEYNKKGISIPKPNYNINL